MEQEEAQGALSQMADQPSGRAIARNLAYGADVDSPVYGALASVLDPARARDTEEKAFWAGMTGPNSGGMSSVSNALEAQTKARTEQDKLRAAYVPMIMQAMAQQRANEIAYGNMLITRQKETNPIINSALYGLQADGNQPTLKDAHNVIQTVGAKYALSPAELAPHHNALEAGAGPDGSRLGSYLQQLRVAAAPPDAGINKFGKNAAGADVVQNPVAGTQGVVGAPKADANPTTSAVKAHEAGQGDIKAYGEGLAGNVQTYQDMLQRVNAVQSSLKDFVPGRYAGVANAGATALQDLSDRFPNLVGSQTLKDMARALTSNGGKGDPIAAAQFAEAIKAQESIAQVKTMLANGEGASSGQLSQSEFNKTYASLPGNLTTPGAFKKFTEFLYGQHNNALNKLEQWNGYTGEIPYEKQRVTEFESKWARKMAEPLTQGGFGDLTTPGTKPQGVEQPAAAPAAEAPRPAPAQATPAPAAKVERFDPTQWEKGALLGPTGKVLVRDPAAPGGWRLAKPGGRAAAGRVQ